MTLVQTEPKAIKIGSTDVKKIMMRPLIKDTQGPCANGYHVPSREENTAIVDAMTTLGIDTSTGTCMKTYLKMPYAGYRNYTNSNTTAQGTAGRYWACTRLNINTASALAFGAASVTPQSNANAAYGFSIRPFKNWAVIPDSTWTTLFDGSLIATDAGIFHNATDGIISISADGINWITIADKNLGATVVYNDGDALAETNCGGYFQWGNNYMFPFTGAVTTSSTQVDASNYGPGNWYSSSIFITGNYDWSSVQNDNLRGEAVGVLTEKQIRPVWWTSLTADLTTQSLADLQAAGWTGILQSHGYSLDSNGLTPIGNTSALYYYYGDLSTDSVIELEMTGYASRNYSNHDYQYNAYCALGLATSAVGYGTSSYMAITTTGIAGTYNASNPIWMKCGTIYQNTLIGNEVSGNTAGNVNMKFKLDLKNKKVEYTITSPVSATTTGILTDSQVQTILGYKYIRIEAGKWDVTAYSHVYTAKLRIGG